MLILRGCVLALVWLLPASGARSAVRLEWMRTFDGAAHMNDNAMFVVLDDEGRATVVGCEGDASSAKPSLDEVRERCARPGIFMDSSLDEGQSCVWRVIRFGPRGEVIWTSSREGAWATACAQDSRGDVVVTGFQSGADARGPDWLLVKYGADGSVKWSRTYRGAGGGGGHPYAVAIDSKDEIVVGGFIRKKAWSRTEDWLVLKVGPSGRERWRRSFDSPAHDSDVIKAVAVGPDDSVVAVGFECRSDLGLAHCMLVRTYAAGGGLLWQRRILGGDWRQTFANWVAVDAHGNTFVVGGEKLVGRDTREDWLILKFDRAGRTLWKRMYDSPAGSEDSAYCVALDRSGNAIVAGVEWRPDLGRCYEWRIRKYSAAGDLMWNERYAGPAGLGDSAFGVAWRNDSLVVVGYSDRTDLSQGRDWVVRKYADAVAPSGERKDHKRVP